MDGTVGLEEEPFWAGDEITRGAGFRMNCRESMHRLISQYSL